MTKSSSSYLKVKACRLSSQLARPSSNYATLENYAKSVLSHDPCHIFITPELFLTGFSCEELFFDGVVQSEVRKSIYRLKNFSQDHDTIYIIGTPLYSSRGIFNCALVVQRGKILAAIPKTYLAVGSEYYEERYFDTVTQGESFLETDFGDNFIVGASQLIDIDLQDSDHQTVRISAEICEDLWAPISPSTYAFSNGALVVFNLSASNALYGKSIARHTLANSLTQRFKSNYIYVSSGVGESNNDVVWDGEIFASQSGVVIDTSYSFDEVNAKGYALPMQHLQNSRKRYRTAQKSLVSNTISSKINVQSTLTHSIIDQYSYKILESVKCYPYLGSDDPKIDNEQVNFIEDALCQALLTRCEGSGISNLVLGVSGGLDSTFALLILDLFRNRHKKFMGSIKAISLPSQNTSLETSSIANNLCSSLSIPLQIVDLQDSINLRLLQLNRDPNNLVLDTTYENIQAGERTSFLFRFANNCNGLVIGTSDLSELALGWCTYGVGDHMSHYSLNCGIPKTVIQAYIDFKISDPSQPKLLTDTLSMLRSFVITPELLPKDVEKGIQSTEQTIGKYCLIDFFLYYYLDRRYSFDDIADLATKAFRDNQEITSLDVDLVLSSFKKRFFSSQFKRTAIPNGPKLFQNGSLSPRSDWRQPSIIGK